VTLSEIQQLVSLKLGEQTAFYPTNEVTRSGINPAQRLLCLVYPLLLRQRATVTVVADMPFIDLRTLTDASGLVLGTRIRRIRRVVLGNVSADAPTRNAATDELTELRETSVAALAGRANDWMRHQGAVRHYWRWGPYWLGLYRRPIDTTTVTVIYDAAPVVLTLGTDTPQVQDVYHRVIADVATGLLLVKEGAPQGAHGVTRIVEALNLQQAQEAS